MIYRSKMILWFGAIIIHPWMILFIQLWWWWWWWLVMMLKGCLLHKQSLKGLGVVQSCAFSKLLHGVCFRIGKHSIVGPSLYHIITHQQTQGCLCIYDQGELWPQGWGRGISLERGWYWRNRWWQKWLIIPKNSKEEAVCSSPWMWIYIETVTMTRSLRWPVRRWR